MTLDIEALYSSIPHNLSLTVKEKILTTRSMDETKTH